MKLAAAVALLLRLSNLLPGATFTPHEIATGLKGGYQVVVADLNRDGRPDLIAVAPGTNELVWFENPGWQRHVILSNVLRMINCAAWDTDGDGIPEIALAYEFSNNAAKSIGVVSILHSGSDPALPWTATEIDRLPTSHRLRWAAIDRSGKRVLLNAPLTDALAQHPEDRLPVPLVYYIPGEWKRRETAPGNEGVQHGILVTPGKPGKPDRILTASFSGISRFVVGSNGKWSRELLASGSPESWPKSGSSDIVSGHTRGKEFLAALEPWHGNQVAIYRKSGRAWRREVIDASLSDGHTLVASDFDGNGDDMIVAGQRAGDRSLHLYRSNGKGWTASLLDEGKMAAAACVVADLNGDGRQDIACISPVGQNLKWYENKAP